MGPASTVWDTSVVESFSSTLKIERTNCRHYWLYRTLLKSHPQAAMLSDIRLSRPSRR